MQAIVLFSHYLSQKQLKHSAKRDWILAAFLSMERHVTVHDVWVAVKKTHPTVGFATVYRTLRLMRESGLCRELRFEDGTTRYEHALDHEHHDHIICTKCGRCIEVVDTTIEKLQEQLMQRHGFSLSFHRMNLYGICKKCRKKA
jgi:Fur family ferric uptake transcriptional regulator